MLTLFHHPFCPHSRFVRIVLAEYGVGVRLVEGRAWESREAFLGVHRAGGAGAGRAATGAAMIAENVDATHGPGNAEGRLLPEQVEARVEVRRIAGWFNDKFFDEVSGPLAMERVFKSGMSAEQGGGTPD